MTLLIFGQLFEIITMLILSVVLIMLYKFDLFTYIKYLRNAFIAYLAVICFTVISPLVHMGEFWDSSIKYVLLAIISIYIYTSFKNKGRFFEVKWVTYIYLTIVVVLPLMMIGMNRLELLEGLGYILFGSTSILMGVFWFRSVMTHLYASRLVGIMFILFGVHLMDFIVFQYDDVTIVVGYMAAAVIEMVITFSLVFLNFTYQKEQDHIKYSKYSNLFNNSTDAIFLINNDIIFQCNKKAETLFETTADRIIGSKPMELSVDVQRNGRSSYEYGEALFKMASSGDVTRFDWIHLSFKGKKIICEVALFTIEKNQFAAIIRDMTDKNAYEEEIKFRKYYDGLTRLPKRALFIDRLNRYLEDRFKNVALIAFNIDHFKEINDEYGHEAGDQLLQQVAARVHSAFKKDITLTRLGADEFVAIMDSLQNKNIIYLPIEKIQSAFDAPFEIENNLITVSICIGVAFPESETTLSKELLQNADLALNIAKGKGRGRLEFYSEIEKEVFTNRVSMEREMIKGLDENEFIPYYQPIMDTKTNTIKGVEALARWIKKDGTMVYPDAFIPIAEETELIKDIGEKILLRACEDFSNVLNRLPDFVIHVNLSPLQLKDDSIVKSLKYALEHHKITARHLAIELTEMVFIEDANRTNDILKQIRSLGIGVALDDFGTGYSSLSYLDSMQVDTIKIDRSFVVKLPKDKKSRYMMEYLTGLLHELGYLIVVEGVEEKDQADYLISLNCDAIQGYYYYRPMSFEDLQSIIFPK